MAWTLASEPMPAAIGPYRILEQLGRGGMGIVYRGQHRDSNELAAIKTVPVPDPALLQSLRREIHSLACLSHPGVVRILETGLHNGLPWYSMELVEGLTLLRYRDGLWPHEQSPIPREALRRLLTILRRLCSALAYLHGEGLVHRDLKPENIIVTERPEASAATELDAQPRPVLVDFGLSGRVGGDASREVLDPGGIGSGSTAYMAPEQMRGETVDARADLYSLGCILYVLLTGRLPFRSVHEVQDPQLRPTAPSQLIETVPPELDALVLRLLAKEPRGRPGHADDVAVQLGRHGAGNGHSESGARPRSRLLRPALAGRGDTLQTLGRWLGDHTLTGQGGVMLVGGESGIGKTRLVMEVARAAPRRGLRVLTGECFAAGAGAEADRLAAPLQALIRPLHQVADECRAGGLAVTERLLGVRGPLLSRYALALAGLPGQDVAPQVAELPADAARLRLFWALTETFAALAEAPAPDGGMRQRPVAPLLLILDDLQWADDLTTGWLEFLSRSGRIAERPLLILGTYRKEDVLTPGSAALRSVLEAPQVARIELGRLNDGAVGELVADMLAIRPAPPTLVAFLARQTEGNPFFVAEVLHAAVAEGILVRDRDGGWQTAFGEREKDVGAALDALPLPGTVRELVARRLESLSPLAASVLEAAAVLGVEMVELLPVEVAGAAGTDGFEAVRELLARQVLRESGAGLVRFDHGRIREVAYERIPVERRRMLHRSAAEALERTRRLDGADPVDLLASLGHHWGQAHEPVRARRHFIEGARKAVFLHAFSEAERLYDAYLALVDGVDAEAIKARNERAFDVLGPRGRHQEALAEHALSLREATDLGDRVGQGASLYYLAIAAAYTGQFHVALEHGSTSLALHRELGDLRSEAADLGLLASMRQKLGQTGEAKDLYREGLERAREAGDRTREGKLLGSLGLVHHEEGSILEAQSLYHQALEIHREIADRRWEGVTLNGLANIAEREGRLADARKLYEQSLLTVREVVDWHAEGMTSANLAGLALKQGRHKEAVVLYEQALSILRESGDRWSEAVTLTNLAEARRQMGEMQLAEEHLERALELHHSTGIQRYEGFTNSRLAHLRHCQGRIVEARQSHARAAELLRAAHHPKLEGIALVSSALLERRLGELDRAADQLTAAERLLRQAGDKADLALCLCEQAHLSLAGGTEESDRRLARSRLEEVEGLAVTNEVGSESALAQAVGALRRAVEAAEAGAVLFRGELLEALPSGLRQHLVETRQLSGEEGD